MLTVTITYYYYCYYYTGLWLLREKEYIYIYLLPPLLPQQPCDVVSADLIWHVKTRGSGGFTSSSTKLGKGRAGTQTEVLWSQNPWGESRRKARVFTGDLPRSPEVHSGRQPSCVWSQVRASRWSGYGDMFSSCLPLCPLPLLLFLPRKQALCHRYRNSSSSSASAWTSAR